MPLILNNKNCGKKLFVKVAHELSQSVIQPRNIKGFSIIELIIEKIIMGFSIIEFIIDTEDFKENETKAKKLREKRKCQRKK